MQFKNTLNPNPLILWFQNMSFLPKFVFLAFSLLLIFWGKLAFIAPIDSTLEPNSQPQTLPER